jgi:hypothetical protein
VINVGIHHVLNVGFAGFGRIAKHTVLMIVLKPSLRGRAVEIFPSGPGSMP